MSPIEGASLVDLTDLYVQCPGPHHEAIAAREEGLEVLGAILPRT